MMTLDEAVKKVRPLDEKAMEGARKRWDSIAKPLHSLGELENMLTQIAGITGTPEVRVEKKAVVAMCADNGVVEEGVTQTGQEVTAVVAENFLEGTTTCCVMCRQCGAELFPVDVGMVTDTKVRTDLKVAYGTRNMTREAGDDKRSGDPWHRSRNCHGRGAEGKRLSGSCNRRDGHWKYHHQQCGSSCASRKTGGRYDRTWCRIDQ